MRSNGGRDCPVRRWRTAGDSGCDRGRVGWRWGWVALLLTVAGPYAALPERAQAVSYVLTGIVASGAVLWSVQAFRPVNRAPWIGLSLACALSAIGDAIYLGYIHVLGQDPPLLSAADAGYHAGMLVLIASVIGLLRSILGTVSLSYLLDVALIAASLVLILWVALLSKIAIPSDDWITVLLAIIMYPIYDIILLASLIALLLTPGSFQRGPTGFLALAILCFLIGDVGYLWLAVSGAYVVGTVLDYSWLAGYVGIAFAALDPTMGRLNRVTRPDGEFAGIFHKISLVLLPVLVFVVALSNTSQRTAIVGGALLLALAGARMAVLFESLEKLYRRVARSEQRFRFATLAARDVIFEWDLRTDTIVFGSLDLTAFGCAAPPQGWTGRSIIERIHPDDRERVLSSLTRVLEGAHDRWTAEFRCKRLDGGDTWVVVRGIVVRDETDTPNTIVGAFTDVSELRELEQQAWYGLHDPLTGLWNRRALEEYLASLVRAFPPVQQIAILFIDLDDFKAINDAYGHHVGDQFLREVADRLRRCLREKDFLARIGGDEFVAVLEQVTPERALMVGQRIESALRESLCIEDRRLTASASIGIVLAHPHQQTYDRLLVLADRAMYRAKGLGKGRIVLDRDEPGTDVVVAQ